MGDCRVPVLTALLLFGAGNLCAQQRNELPATNVLVQWRVDEGIDLPGYRGAGSPQWVNPKSTITAVGLSLLLPGAGHVYAGSGGRAKFFFGTEAVVWGLALAFDRWSAWKLNSATDLAVQRAGLLAEGKDDEFLEYLEFYTTRGDFNIAGRIIEPDREFLAETRDTYWHWETDADRQTYRDLRNASSAAARNRNFMFYAAVLTRAASAADAYRVVRQEKTRVREEEGLKLSVRPRFSLRNPGIALNARYRF